MSSTYRTRVTPLLAAALCALSFAAASAPSYAQNQEPQAEQKIIKEVRHQLVMLPYYSVFDNLAFRVEGNKVILEGQVVRPVLKSDAEAAVKSVEGVSGVVNNIEVLPLSPMDDQLRRALFRSIYGFSSLSRYAESAVPSIHIIVKNGHVTLVGVVDSQADKDTANIRANSVPNVFSVENDLKVVGNSK
ncbi:MAG TPA: BON domain-containing protein [Candidatus Acidoferrum sp.]|jgi:hyperosmotically inducible protein